MTTAPATTTGATRFALSGTGTAVCALGALTSVLAATRLGWDPAMARGLQAVAVLMWSPLLPFGLPALATQDLRDTVAAARRTDLGGPSVAGYLFVTGPAALLRFSWANLAGVAVAADAAAHLG